MPPSPNAVRWGFASALVVLLTFLSLSWGLGVRTGSPIATRTDLFFQSDAGGLVTDAKTDFTARGRGVHPILYFVWTKPLYHLSRALESGILADVTATVGSRLLVALWAGAGMGVLVFGLIRRGVPGSAILAVAPVYLLGCGQAMACMPDHFGMSQGILAASFGVYIAPGRFGRKFAALAFLALLAGGITVTNVAFPAGLCALLVLGHYGSRLPWRWIAGAVAITVLTLAAGIAVLFFVGDLLERFVMRVEGYLTWRLTDDPLEALKFTFRGLVDAVVAPTPAVTRDNLDKVPMLTYQPVGQSYSAWPYDLGQSVGAVAWLVLLIMGTARALRSTDLRIPTSVLIAWVFWNAIFHNLWGDEYFLYTPHYSWALVALSLLGWQRISSKWIWLVSAPAASAAASTLWQYRELIASIEN